MVDRAELHAHSAVAAAGADDEQMTPGRRVKQGVARTSFCGLALQGDLRMLVGEHEHRIVERLRGPLAFRIGGVTAQVRDTGRARAGWCHAWWACRSALRAWASRKANSAAADNFPLVPTPSVTRERPL